MSLRIPSLPGFSTWMLPLAVAGALVLSGAARAEDRSWLERSDRNTAMVFETLGAFDPEWMSSVGVERFDTEGMDLKPGRAKRADAALGAVSVRLAALKKSEADARVREDLDITIDALARMRRTAQLEERLLVPYRDLPREMFEGLQMLLDKRNPEARQQHALERLRRYAGMAPGSTPLVQLARERTMARANAKLVWPYRGEVEQQLHNCARYVAGVAELFRASTVAGWEPPHERLARQVREYCDWLRGAVLPRARAAPALPRELYADRLKNVGVDVTPEQAIALGMTTFAEVRDEMTRLAGGDYRERLRELKREPLAPERILPLYRERLADIERIIVREGLLTLPERAASIRLASEAESAAIPAPYLSAPRLVGNRGERGEFVLPLTNPNAKSKIPADDFTAPAAAWTLTAHEARPGHELQFAAMVERGVPLARAVFAWNSTNAEGWALYAEAIMTPYFPAEGQFFALQMRLMRAARAFLDPLVNLGRITPEAAKEYLMREVTLSEPLAQQEADRYAFRAPGQAVSYLYGYSRLRELRMKAEMALGGRFEQREFHDLIMTQGLLPPALLERAVLGELTRRYPGTSTTPAPSGAAGSDSHMGTTSR